MTEDLAQIWHFGHVGSCLDVAYGLAKRGMLAPWDSVLCQSQSQGRGQMRRHWQSPPGNVYATLRLPTEPPFNGDFAAPAMGCLLAQALIALQHPTQIKWPNDLVVNVHGKSAKFGGILLEERSGIVLAGIGINLSSCPDAALLRKEHALPATSLAALGFSDLLPQKFWQTLVRRTIKAYKETKSFASAWPKVLTPLLLWRGRMVEVELPGHEDQLVRGILLGLASSGGFMLMQNGSEREIMGGHLKLC